MLLNILSHLLQKFFSSKTEVHLMVLKIWYIDYLSKFFNLNIISLKIHSEFLKVNLYRIYFPFYQNKRKGGKCRL